MYSANNPNLPAPHQFGQKAPVTGVPITSINHQYPTQNYMQPAGKVPWSTGLCDCGSNVPNCCITCWCPCITFGKIAEIVGQGTTPCGASGALYALLNWFTGCACMYSCFYRSTLRNKYMLEETPCEDCCVHLCCETCALCQEYRELENRGFDMSLGWRGNMERRQILGVPVPVPVPVPMPLPTAPVVETGMKR